MKNKKGFRSRLWDSEDNHIFGELFLIVGSVLLARFIESIIPEFSKWIYLGVGFLFVLWGVKLLRRV